MLTYLFIGLFVAAFNTLWKMWLEQIGKLETKPSILTFLLVTVLWPFAIYVMIKKGIEIYNGR